MTGTPEPPRTRALSAKLLAPPTRGTALARPELERRLDEALERRLTLVVANAGFGKSTLLAAWSAGVRSCWYTVTAEDVRPSTLARGLVGALRVRVPGLPPEVDAAGRGWRGPAPHEDEVAHAQAFAAALCDALDQRLRRDLVLVVEDIEELGDSEPSIRLLEALCRQAPRTLHLVVTSRTDVPFAIERLRGAGEVLELGAEDLAFTPAETGELLADVLGAEAGELAQPVHEATGGWPAATRLAIEALCGVAASAREATLARLRQPGGAVYSYLAAEVFQREPASTRALVQVSAVLESFTADTCEALGIAGAAAIIAGLARRGLFLEPQPQPAGWFALGALVRRFAAAEFPLPDAERRRVHLRAAEWYERAGFPEAALRSAVAGEDPAAVAALLDRQGQNLLSAGAADGVVAAIETLPAAGRSREVEQLLGEALHLRGDWDGALAAFGRAGAGLEAVPAAVAWRVGLIHHLQGRLDAALAAYASAQLDGGDPANEALVLSWSASAHWLRGDADTCRAHATAAFEAASASGDARALAAAHTALALLAALEGDRGANDAHYLRALDHARRAGDILQTIRIHANRGSHYAEEGDYDAALAELELGIALADLGGYSSLRALAFSNRGDVEFRIGQLDEAVADLQAAKALYQSAGSRMVAYPLAKLGELYRERGDAGLARAACEEAVALAEEAHDVQGLVPALAALSRVLAGEAPEEALALARRAVELGPGMGYVQALVAAGWAALAAGDGAAATAAAVEAADVARARRDIPGLAEALELAGAADADRAQAAAQLEEARAIWRSIGNPLGVAWTEVRLATVADPADARRLAEGARRCFRELGARAGAAAAERVLDDLDRSTRAPVELRALGRFVVLRDGEPVPFAEWQSKKARDLLKVLVARRGRPVTRDALMELLWPDQDPAGLSGRLSVALATVRSVLDPERRHEREHFVSADATVVRLVPEQLDVDVERFLDLARTALAERRGGSSADATERLELAEAAYTGDFLEEDVYEDWAAPLREEARAAYVEVARALADDARAAGDATGALKYFLRMLERDPYDEHAHLGLVAALAAAGRHGEAHRFYRGYCTRMEQIGVEAAPFPKPGAALSPP